MAFSVAVLDEAKHGKLTAKRATELCAVAFSIRDFDIERIGEVSVALVALPVVHKLNVKYRNIDSPTDVLSFPIDEDDAAPGPRELGDVVICPQHTTDLREAVIHGALHLAGMGHGEDFVGSEMAAVQEAVLRGAGICEEGRA